MPIESVEPRCKLSNTMIDRDALQSIDRKQRGPSNATYNLCVQKEPMYIHEHPQG